MYSRIKWTKNKDKIERKNKGKKEKDGPELKNKKRESSLFILARNLYNMQLLM